jgi:uncharacterized phiE125 gp8 family phage protein
MIVFPAKDASETGIFTVDFTPVLAAGESIASVAVVATGVTVDDYDVAGALVDLTVSGGTEGTVAKITISATSDSIPAQTYAAVAVLEIGGEAVSLAYAKAQQKIDTSDEDEVLAGFLRAAIRYVEKVTGKKLTPKIVKQTLDGFPGGRCYAASPRPIRLLAGPASEILSIDYDDPAGVEQTLTSFRLVEGGDADNGQLLPAYGESWPATASGPATVRLTSIAGYDPTELPPELVQAAVLLFGHFNANREAVLADMRAAAVELPLGVAMLIANYCTPGIA